MATIAIKTTNGKAPKICMDLLTDLAGHRDVCDICHKAFSNRSGKYCVTGSIIIEELLDQPEVNILDAEGSG